MANADEMNGSRPTIDRLLANLQEFLRKKIAFDYETKCLYVDIKTHGNPLFQTWLDRARSEIKFAVDVRELTEILEMKASGLNVKEKEDDEEQKVRQEAIALILLAADYGASDMHFKVSPLGGTSIQLVIEGAVRSFKHMTAGEGERIIRTIYQGVAKARAGSFNPLQFQNAQIAGSQLPQHSNITSIRIVRGPCYPESEGGGFMTLRLQYSNTQSRHLTASKEPLPSLLYPATPRGKFLLPKMGFDNRQVERIERLLSAPNGIILFVGPTGSGKTTTVFECLQKLAHSRPESRQVTTEDPVEYVMPWAVQLGVSDARTEEETGEAFLDRVRVMLRMAPHIILIGEIRGAEVGLAALNASLTGHLTLSTLHVNDPFLSIDRLELMDQTRLNRRVLCDPKIIRGIIAQRLLPHLCKHCREPVSAGTLPHRIISALDSWSTALNITEKQLFVHGKGCAHCHNSGSSGRFAVSEIVSSDNSLMNDFIEHGTTKARRNYRLRADTDTSMLEKAMRFVLTGQVSPVDVEKYIDIIEPYQEGL